MDLEEQKTITLDGSGNGVVYIGPVRSRQRWNVKQLTVSTGNTTVTPKAYVYGPSGTLLGGTYNGSQDTTGLDVTLHFGSRIKVVWEAGDSGISASVSVYGTIEIQ